MANITEVNINNKTYGIKDSNSTTIRATLSYVNGTTLRGGYTLDYEPSCVFTQVRQQSGTPYGQVTNTYAQISGKTVTVTAVGTGFVNGHVLSVDTLVIKS